MLFTKEEKRADENIVSAIAEEDIEYSLQVVEKIRRNINQAFTGKVNVVNDVLTALFSGGHVLLEDVPGVGKTLLAKSLAGSIDGTMSRIQFTPDMMPSDITGMSILDGKEKEFIYYKGPIFNNIILADEINRAGPKSQAALLEVMEENQVSAEGITYELPSLFFVIATQNPTEMAGTYPLPEAQKDRFMMQIQIGYPSLEGEIELLNDGHGAGIVEQLKPACSLHEVTKVKNIATQVYAGYTIRKYVVDLVTKTRNNKNIKLGGSPRSSIQVLKAAKTHALLQGKEYITPDDVKSVYTKILRHRIIMEENTNYSAEEVLHHIVAQFKWEP